MPIVVGMLALPDAASPRRSSTTTAALAALPRARPPAPRGHRRGPRSGRLRRHRHDRADRRDPGLPARRRRPAAARPRRPRGSTPTRGGPARGGHRVRRTAGHGRLPRRAARRGAARGPPRRQVRAELAAGRRGDLRRDAALLHDHDQVAQEIHDLGLAQIAKLADEYRALGPEVVGTDDLAAIFEAMRTDPKLHFEQRRAARRGVARSPCSGPGTRCPTGSRCCRRRRARSRRP